MPIPMRCASALLTKKYASGPSVTWTQKSVLWRCAQTIFKRKLVESTEKMDMILIHIQPHEEEEEEIEGEKRD